MKRQISLLVFLIVVLFNFKPVLAQSLNVFGVKGGVHFVDIKDKLTDEGVTHVNKTGFYLGAFLEFRRSVNFSVQPEVYYSINN